MQEGFSEVFEEFDKYGISCDTYYIDGSLQAWLVPAAMVYSRTPADFEFKLPETGLLLGDVHALAAHLRSAVDIAFPVVHGCFGEDGQLSSALRDAGVPFVGSPPEASGVAFNKVLQSLTLLCRLSCRSFSRLFQCWLECRLQFQAFSHITSGVSASVQSNSQLCVPGCAGECRFDAWRGKV